MEKTFIFICVFFIFIFILSNLLSNEVWNKTKSFFSFSKTFELKGELIEPPYGELDFEASDVSLVREIEDPDEPVLVRTNKLKYFLNLRIEEMEIKKEIPLCIFEKLENFKKSKGSFCILLCKKNIFNNTSYVIDIT